MEIKPPSESELGTIITLSPQAIYEGTLGEAKPTREKTKHLIESLLEKGSYYLIAIENNELWGWALVGKNKDQFSNEPIGFVYELFVLEEHRGKGISKQLMEESINQFKQKGCIEVRLNVFEGNRAIKLYEDLGFENKTVTMSRRL